MRKNYLDNIRWCTIILVVFFMCSSFLIILGQQLFILLYRQRLSKSS